MMKLFSRLMLVLALGVTSPAYASQDGEVTLKLIETSDVHGCYFSYDFTSMKPRKGGLACVSSFVKEQREQYGDGVVLIFGYAFSWAVKEPVYTRAIIKMKKIRILCFTDILKIDSTP